MARKNRATASVRLRVVDRRPWLIAAGATPADLAKQLDTRDVYLELVFSVGSECVASQGGVSFHNVKTLWDWWGNHDLPRVYDHGTTDPALRLPSGLDDTD